MFERLAGSEIGAFLEQVHDRPTVKQKTDADKAQAFQVLRCLQPVLRTLVAFRGSLAWVWSNRRNCRLANLGSETENHDNRAHDYIRVKGALLVPLQTRHPVTSFQDVSRNVSRGC